MSNQLLSQKNKKCLATRKKRESTDVMILLGMNDISPSDVSRAAAMADRYANVFTVSEASTEKANHWDISFSSKRGVNSLINRIKPLIQSNTKTYVILDYFFLQKGYYSDFCRYGDLWVKHTVPELLNVGVDMVILPNDKYGELQNMIDKEKHEGFT